MCVSSRPSGFETVYGYNGDDALVSVRDANGRGTLRGADALGRTTSYEYPDGGVQTLSYDGEGNLRGMTQPNTGARSFDIDALNRTTGDDATGSGGSLTLLRRFDPNGNVLANEMTGAFSGSGVGRKVTRVYDTLEHLRSEKTELTGGSGISPALDNFDATLTFTPDASGNRIGGTDAKGTQSTGTFDIADRPTSLVTSDGSVTLNWRRDGTLRSIEQSNGTTSTYDYDHAKRVKLITHRVGGVPSLTLEYDYDSNGNRTDETRTEIALPGQPARTVHTHYGFDSDDRLTSAEVTYTPANPQTPNTRTVWTLDPVGNRLTEVVTNTQTNQALNSKTYTYSVRDQLETVTDSVTQLRVVYGYDLNGNRTQRTVTRGPGNTLVSRTFYRFDARDRLDKAEPEAPNPTNIPTVEFVYDAEDRKIARIETPWLNGSPVPANAQATVSLYDGQSLLHEAKPGSGGTSNSQGLIITDTYRNSAKLDRHVSYGPNGTDQPTIRFYQLDALGTPLILTDSNGQAIVSNTVDAWGNTIQQTADGNSTAPVNSGNQSQDPNQTGQAALLTNDDQSIGFTGYQKDEDLGLYYAGARFYDPLIGGFGAMDPWTGDTGRPITLNKYLYANGNPVFFVDPDGRTPEAAHFFATLYFNQEKAESFAQANFDTFVAENPKTGVTIGVAVGAGETVADIATAPQKLVEGEIKYWGANAPFSEKFGARAEFSASHATPMLVSPAWYGYKQLESFKGEWVGAVEGLAQANLNGNNYQAGKAGFKVFEKGIEAVAAGLGAGQAYRALRAYGSAASAADTASARSFEAPNGLGKEFLPDQDPNSRLGVENRGPAPQSIAGESSTTESTSTVSNIQVPPKGPLKNLEVGGYKELNKRGVVGDDITPDHQPSLASIVEKEEARLNRKLTPAEYRQLRDCTTCIAIPDRVHKRHSRTYGGRNTPEQIKSDSLNSQDAARLDGEALRQALIDDGFSEEEVNEAFRQRDLRNIQDGRY